MIRRRLNLFNSTIKKVFLPLERLIFHLWVFRVVKEIRIGVFRIKVSGQIGLFQKEIDLKPQVETL